MDSSAAAGAGAALPPPLPQTGWLLKQSGGKVGGKKGVLSGNVSALVSSSATHDFSDLLLRTPAHALLFLQALAKWDRRWFVLRAGSPLTYYKDPREAEKGGQPAGSLECSGCTMERGVGGHEAQFALRTAERVLTLRAPSATEMNAWLLAAVACGGQASFAKELPSKLGLMGEALPMPGMEGYLHKQSGGKAGGGTKGEMLKKWDRRYFVCPAGRSYLRYYKPKDWQPRK